ncbi:hypothetical protein NZK35_23185 [Stieleria sp. ICT_E10.1]|uniref:hypothetical protein n=1 Tax=Stieleria sedimenti TaxID=2976331 RepID=UPI00217F3A06|nr:hypothetical protein [Stieleria sedimenti]MCS7469567.1 hypothetical protein [Stieleria sedimenti]
MTNDELRKLRKDHHVAMVSLLATKAAHRLRRISGPWYDRKSIFDGSPNPDTWLALVSNDKAEEGDTHYEGHDILKLAGLDADRDRDRMEESYKVFDKALPDFLDDRTPVPEQALCYRKINQEAALQLMRLAKQVRELAAPPTVKAKPRRLGWMEDAAIAYTADPEKYSVASKVAKLVNVHTSTVTRADRPGGPWAERKRQIDECRTNYLEKLRADGDRWEKQRAS